MGDIGAMRYLASKGVRRATLGASLLDPLIGLDEPMVAAVLRAGADPNFVDEDGRTALHWAAMIYAGHDRFVRRMLARGGDLRIRDKEGKTPLELAREHMNVPVVKLLERWK
jgi:ankyrin repeat protein